MVVGEASGDHEQFDGLVCGVSCLPSLGVSGEGFLWVLVFLSGVSFWWCFEVGMVRGL